MRLLITLFIAIAAITACQPGPPPTLLVMEVTREVTVVVTAQAEAAVTGTPEATDAVTPSATATQTSTMTPTPDVFPTPVVGQIYIAEQSYQTGRMLWLQPIDQIWVIYTDEAGRNIWAVYNDTFEEGMLETDPTIEAQIPEPGLIQPERGFGKLWRENPEIRNRLGWAIEPEFGYSTRYEYRAGGEVNAQNEYVPGPGVHLVETLNREVLTFDVESGTWSIRQDG